MKRKENVYKENPYLVLFDAAEELGVFEFFESKSRQEGKNSFYPVEEIYSGCHRIPEVYKGVDCPRKKKCLFRDRETNKTPCEDFYNKNYPPIRCPFKESSKQTFYFLMICLTSEMEFFEKKGKYFRKKYEGSAGESKHYEILESGVYNHIFDLKDFLDFSNSHKYFIEFGDELIKNPHHKKTKNPYSDELFFNKDAISLYLKGMAGIAYNQLPEFLSITDFSECRSILDIGPGPRVYSMGIFKKLRNLHTNKTSNKNIEIFGMDFDTVKDWHDSDDYSALLDQELSSLKTDEFDKKFTFVPILPGVKAGEYQKDALFSDKTWNQDLLRNRQFDAILLQNVLCHNSKKHAKLLIEQCYKKLNFGGKIKIQEYFKDISESEPFASVVLSLYFRSISYTGQTFTNFELSQMLFECGFRDIRQLKSSTFSSIIEAEKIFPIEKDEVLKRFWRLMFIMNHLNNKQEGKGGQSKGQPLDFESIYTVDIISIFKKSIIEYKKDILEIKEKEENKERENYIRRFMGKIDDFQNEKFFEILIKDIEKEIKKCTDKLEECWQKNDSYTSQIESNSQSQVAESINKKDNGCEEIIDLDAETIKCCWKLLFHLNLLDKDIISEYPHDREASEIKKAIYSKNEKFIIKLLKNSKCPDHLVIFFLLQIFKELPNLYREEIAKVVEYISELEEPYFVVRQLQKYFGPGQEACKFNLLNCIVNSDKLNDPSGFIYLWTLRWFLTYEILNKDEFEYHLLVEEFSESRYEFVKQEVIKLKEVLDVKNETFSQSRIW